MVKGAAPSKQKESGVVVSVAVGVAVDGYVESCVAVRV